MGMFAAMDIAVSGATVSRTWMDAISHNIANLNTVNPAGEEPFRALIVAAEAVRFDDGERGGVRVQQITTRRRASPPSHTTRPIPTPTR